MKLEICENDAALRAPILDFAELGACPDFLLLLAWRAVHMRYRHTLIVPNLVSQFFSHAVTRSNTCLVEQAPLPDEIVEFSGIEAHLDSLVRGYSAGMQVREAFHGGETRAA